MQRDKEDFSDDDDDPNQETVAEDGDPELLHEATLTDDPKDMEVGIAQLSSAGLIDKDMRNHLVNLHKTAFRRVTNSSVPLFEEVDTQSKKVLPRHKHSPVVAITHNGENLFINKTTAVWLLQENERVSTDRLFRVRAQQPYCSTPQVLTHKPESTVPVVQESIGVDDVCVFSDKVKKWKIGKVLQFSHYLEKQRVLISIVAQWSTYPKSLTSSVSSVHGMNLQVLTHLHHDFRLNNVKVHIPSYLSLHTFVHLLVVVSRRLREM